MMIPEHCIVTEDVARAFVDSIMDVVIDMLRTGQMVFCNNIVMEIS